ncbi:T9SS type A sorting domain-containing protein [Formosa haliotis]|uniref:T9SS type A sorting domain-containing protein n=1 Tax=Formosa haliotis TaxID=1555194 RepID=UPI0008248D9D|nr:T9SS type A sorting domain-containing protein [Formosa haliotis]
MFIPILFFMMGHAVAQTVTVNSLEELLPYLKQSDVDVKLAPGTYSINGSDIDDGTFSNPLFLFEGSNNVYDFTDVKIEISTEVLTKFGNVDVNEFQILGNDNVLKNLTIEDIGTTAPTNRAQSIVMDGRDNRIEGFDLTIRGSFPYGYGDAFGKGGGSVINHRKHSGVLIRGLRNHLKDCNIISRSYGHIVFMQAASHPTVEGCYIEGEMRSTDDMLAEAGTGTPADNVDFMTVWGYKLPAGYMMSLQEGGIRAYDAGTTYIDGEEIQRGTDNPTVLNCTVKNARTGVTLAHASGTKIVDNVTLLGCEQGYSIGSGTVSNCSADAQYGPVLSFAYSSDSNTDIDITVLPSDNHYNGSGTVAYIGGKAHNITLRGGESNNDLKIQVGGDKNNIRLLGVTSNQNPLSASSLQLNNYTDMPVVLDEMSTSVVVKTCGAGEIIDKGVSNSLLDCSEEASGFPNPEKAYRLGNNRFRFWVMANGTDQAFSLSYHDDINSGTINDFETLFPTSTESFWTFTPVEGREGYFYIDCIGGGEKPRLTATMDSGLPVMSAKTVTDASVQWSVVQPEGRLTYHITNDNARLIGANSESNQAILVAPGNTTNQSRFEVIEVLNYSLSIKNESLNNDILMFPNPTTDILNVEIKQEGSAQVEVFSLTGQKVISKFMKKGMSQLDLSQLLNGMYIVKIESDSGTQVKKVVKH